MEQSIEELEQELANAFDEARETIKKMSEMNFGYEIISHEDNGSSDLGSVDVVMCSTANGVVFVPTIRNYVYSNVMYVSDGYQSREEALRCVGRCWDLAHFDVIRQIEEKDLNDAS